MDKPLVTKHNRADITRNELSDHPAQGTAKTQLQLAGVNLSPIGFGYQSSIAVHLYQKPGTHDFIFISQLADLHEVSEGHADVALKELRRALMKAYGREDNRRSDTKEEIL